MEKILNTLNVLKAASDLRTPNPLTAEKRQEIVDKLFSKDWKICRQVLSEVWGNGLPALLPDEDEYGYRIRREGDHYQWVKGPGMGIKAHDGLETLTTVDGHVLTRKYTIAVVLLITYAYKAQNKKFPYPHNLDGEPLPIGKAMSIPFPSEIGKSNKSKKFKKSKNLRTDITEFLNFGLGDTPKWQWNPTTSLLLTKLLDQMWEFFDESKSLAEVEWDTPLYDTGETPKTKGFWSDAVKKYHAPREVLAWSFFSAKYAHKHPKGIMQIEEPIVADDGEEYIEVIKNEVDIACIAFTQARPFLEAELGGEFTTSHNLYWIDSYNFVSLDWQATKEDVEMAVDVLATTSQPTNTSEPEKSRLEIEVEKHEKTLYFVVNEVRENFIKVDKNGVRDDSDQQLRGCLKVNPLVGEHDASKNDLQLLNGWTTFYLALCENCRELIYAKNSWQDTGGKQLTNQLYRSLVNNLQFDSSLPFANSNEVNVSEGTREFYLQNVTKPVTANILLPFGFDRANAVDAHLLHDLTEVTEEWGCKPAQISDAAFDLNLIQEHKSKCENLLNMDMMCLRMKHLPGNEAEYYIRKLANQIAGTSPTKEVNVADILRQKYGKYLDGNETDQEVINWAKKNVIITYSTKKAKLTKRVIAAYGESGKVLGDRVKKDACVMIGQEERGNGHEYNVVLLFEHVYMPGQCIELGEPQPFEVHHSFTYSFEQFMFYERVEGKSVPMILAKIPPKGKINNQKYQFQATEAEGYELNYVKEANKYISNYDPITSGLEFEKGEILAYVPFLVHAQDETEKRAEVVLEPLIAPDTAVLDIIEWKITEVGSLQVRIHYHTVEWAAKHRGSVKAMPAKTLVGERCIYNKCNATLDKKWGRILPGIDYIYPSDTLKFKDLISTIVPIAAQTLLGKGSTEEEKKMITRLNEKVGYPNVSDHLIFSPVAHALEGIYEELLAWFKNKFGRPIWLGHLDVLDGMLGAVQTLYENKTKGENPSWFKIKPHQTGCSKIFPSDATCYANSKKIDARTNILVFWQNNNRMYMLQRAFGYVGTDVAKSHVLLNVKPEVSSVRTACSSSNVMFSIPMGLCEKNLNAGRVMMGKEAVTQQEIYMSMQGMLLGRKFSMYKEKEPPVALEIIPLLKKEETNYGPSEKVTKFLSEQPDYNELLTEASSGKLTLERIAKMCEYLVFNLNTEGIIRASGQSADGNGKGNAPFHLYIPAILALEPKSPYQRETLGTLVKRLFGMIITRHCSMDYVRLIRRIYGYINSWCQSKNALKRLTKGRTSAQCKLVGALGLPTGELWVLKAENKGKNEGDGCFYTALRQAFLKLGKRNINGLKVVCARAPLPFTAVLTVQVIEKTDPQAVVLTRERGAVSPLLCYVSGGDYDGDDYNFTPAPEHSLKELTTEEVLKIVTKRTGTDALSVEQECYIADHWGEQKPPTGNLIDQKYFTCEPELKRLAKMATVHQTTLVGTMHEYAYRYFIAYDVASALKKLGFKMPNIWLEEDIRLPVLELYENLLGGLNEDVHEVCSHIFFLMYQMGSSDLLPRKFAELLKSGGLNQKHAVAYEAIAMWTNDCRKRTSAVDAQTEEEKQHAITMSLVELTTDILFKLSKGTLVLEDPDTIERMYNFGSWEAQTKDGGKINVVDVAKTSLAVLIVLRFAANTSLSVLKRGGEHTGKIKEMQEAYMGAYDMKPESDDETTVPIVMKL